MWYNRFGETSVSLSDQQMVGQSRQAYVKLQKALLDARQEAIRRQRLSRRNAGFQAFQQIKQECLDAPSRQHASAACGSHASRGGGGGSSSCRTTSRTSTTWTSYSGRENSGTSRTGRNPRGQVVAAARVALKPIAGESSKVRNYGNTNTSISCDTTDSTDSLTPPSGRYGDSKKKHDIPANAPATDFPEKTPRSILKSSKTSSASASASAVQKNKVVLATDATAGSTYPRPNTGRIINDLDGPDQVEHQHTDTADDGTRSNDESRSQKNPEVRPDSSREPTFREPPSVNDEMFSVATMKKTSPDQVLDDAG